MNSEREIAGLTGMEQTSGSGCGIIQKGDVGNSLWHIEDKSSRKESMSIQSAWIVKAIKQAKDTNKKHWAVALTFVQRHGDYMGPMRFFVIPETYELPGDSSLTRTAGSFKIHAKALDRWTRKGHRLHLSFPKISVDIVSESDFLELIKCTFSS
jgi:hypothetical protein